MEPIGWSKPKWRRGMNKGREVFYGGTSHLLVRVGDEVRARCGVASVDTSTAFPMPPVESTDDICLRCQAPYAKHPTRRSLRAPKGEE